MIKTMTTETIVALDAIGLFLDARQPRGFLSPARLAEIRCKSKTKLSGQFIMITFVRWLERFALPLPVRRKMYERIISGLERKGKVVGRVTRINLREYYRLQEDK